ncbi:MAG: hypothetical protein LBG73_06055 [Spirochaetaceae bacterium]|jgi:hypothetical protein|nr:hypothetical protein [Spirochaetaceae bacterium]
MANKKFLWGMLIAILTFGMTVAGCNNESNEPDGAGENAVSGKTYFDSDTKIVFSATASGAASGTYTKSEKNWQDGGYVETATGSYTWNETANTVTLVPGKRATGSGEPLQTKTEYRASMQAWGDQVIAQYGEEAINQQFATMGFSSLAEYIDYAVEDAFKNVLYNYAFSEDDKALFLDEQLPANIGTNELVGQTYNGMTWVGEGDSGHNEKDTSKTYVFTADTCTYTNGSSTETYRYAYNSKMKLVIFKKPTNDRDAVYTAVASNTTNSDEYNAAQVNDRYILLTCGYNKTAKTINK